VESSIVTSALIGKMAYLTMKSEEPRADGCELIKWFFPWVRAIKLFKSPFFPQLSHYHPLSIFLFLFSLVNPRNMGLVNLL